MHARRALIDRTAPILLLCTLLAVAPRARVSADVADVDALIAAAFTAAYNLDQDAAITNARAAVAAGPDVSRAHRALASVLWLRALFLRGAVTVDHYMGGLTKSQIILPKPPPDIEAEFRHAVTRAIDLADAAHRRDRRDLAALHDLGTAQGLQASWTASVDGRVMAAFGAARKAFDAEETVLNRDPRNVGAGTVVGTYRYAVASLGIASRMVAYLAGFGGDKARAMSLLEAAGRQGDSRFEARTALVLIYSREGRHADAYALLGQMAAEFPRNRILVLEQGAAAIRAGRAPEAEALLTRGLAAFDQDSRWKIPGERALWLYKRGLARLNQNHQEMAAADFTRALGAAPEPWVQGRIHLELGKLADLAGQRTAAIARYRTARDMGRSANDPLGVADADRLLRQPFSMGSD